MIKKVFTKEVRFMLVISFVMFIIYIGYIYLFGIPKTLNENYVKEDVCEQINLLNRHYCKI